MWNYPDIKDCIPILIIASDIFFNTKHMFLKKICSVIDLTFSFKYVSKLGNLSTTNIKKKAIEQGQKKKKLTA